MSTLTYMGSFLQLVYTIFALLLRFFAYSPHSRTQIERLVIPSQLDGKRSGKSIKTNPCVCVSICVCACALGGWMACICCCMLHVCDMCECVCIINKSLHAIVSRLQWMQAASQHSKIKHLHLTEGIAFPYSREGNATSANVGGGIEDAGLSPATSEAAKVLC